MSDRAAPWYREFFERDYYDAFYATLRAPGGPLADEASAQQVDFVVSALALAPPARILDLCCGHGRHSVELARRGFEVVGLDLSAYHIELAEQAAGDAGVSVTFIEDDMRNLPVAPPFDAVLNMFTAFGYLESDAQDAKVIARVADALKPGGRFFIDVNNISRTLRQFQPVAVTRVDDGTLLVEERAYIADAGRLETHWTVVAPSGERREGDFQVRAYTATEYRGMFERAGLRLSASYGDFDGSPLHMDSRRMLLVAEKR